MLSIRTRLLRSHGSVPATLILGFYQDAVSDAHLSSRSLPHKRSRLCETENEYVSAFDCFVSLTVLVCDCFQYLFMSAFRGDRRKERENVIFEDGFCKAKTRAYFRLLFIYAFVRKKSDNCS